VAEKPKDKAEGTEDLGDSFDQNKSSRQLSWHLKVCQADPESITCRSCGRAVEIWSDENETACEGCGAKVSREKGTSCLDYCEYSDKCKELISQKKLK